MPKEGYVSITVATWQLEAASLIMAPGQTFQSFIYNKVLIPQIPKEKLKEIYDKWIQQYYPYGGAKPFED